MYRLDLTTFVWSRQGMVIEQQVLPVEYNEELKIITDHCQRTSQFSTVDVPVVGEWIIVNF